jgi:membrane protein DedA with SNARE-associated domain
MIRVKELLGLIWLPILALAALGIFYGTWTLLNLPPAEEVIEIAKVYFERYGLLVIFVCAIIEGLLLAGWYFPGSFVIVLGVFLAGHDVLQVLGVFATTTAGLLVAYAINFYMGKYGWYRLLAALGFQTALIKAQAQIEHYGLRAVFLTFWHPNLAALTSTAAGILQVPFKKFLLYAIVATILWDTFWTIIGVSLGAAALTVIGPKFVVGFIAIWIAAILYSSWRGHKPQDLLEETSQL